MLLFSLNWFLSIPGILISGGVILLLVALILFIATSKNNKKVGDVPITVADSNVSNPVVSETKVESPVNANDKVEAVKEEAAPIPIDVSANDQSNNLSNPAVAPVSEAKPVVDVSFAPQEVETASVEPVNPTLNEVNNTMVNKPEDVIMPKPLEDSNVEASGSVVNIPSVENVAEMPLTEPEMPAVNNTESHQIYGGADPSVVIEEKPQPHQIYGGADPMEKTQTIPVINDKPTQVYGSDGTTKVVNPPKKDDVEVLDF